MASAGGRQAAAAYKVIARCLPWNLPEDKFKQLLEEEGLRFDFCYFRKGKQSSKRTQSSFATLIFSKLEALAAFLKKFDGRSFSDGKTVSVCIVEYAPFGRIPKNFAPDERAGTIEDDNEFRAFVESSEKPGALPSAEAWLEQQEAQRAAQGPQVAPLVQALRARKAARGRGGKGATATPLWAMPVDDQQKPPQSGAGRRKGADAAKHLSKGRPGAVDDDCVIVDSPERRSGGQARGSRAGPQGDKESAAPSAHAQRLLARTAPGARPADRMNVTAAISSNRGIWGQIGKTLGASAVHGGRQRGKADGGDKSAGSHSRGAPSTEANSAAPGPASGGARSGRGGPGDCHGAQGVQRTPPGREGRGVPQGLRDEAPLLGAGGGGYPRGCGGGDRNQAKPSAESGSEKGGA
eukprot:gene4223-4525_t